MRRHCPHLILTAALLTLIGPGPLQGEEPQPSIDIVGEQLDPSNFGPGIVEGMDAVLARERARAKQKPTNPKARNGRHGTWFVPSRRATFFPASGSNNVVNKWGDTKMGIAFPSATDVYGACFAGQGGGPAVWAKGIRVHGYRDGKLVGTTDWFTEITDAPTHFDINLLGVDRIVIEAKPARDGSGWYGMDDFVFGRQALDGSGRYETVTLDFEDLNRPAKLTGSNYAGLIWESGTGEIPESQTRPEDNIIPAPIPRTRLAGEPADSEPDQAGAPRGTPNPPTLALDFDGVDRDDLNQFSAPPDTCGAVGPNHFVEVVNTVWAVYNKSGTLVMWSSLSSFLPGSSGDPRVLYDQHSGRWVVIVSDFSSRIYLAVSTTNDPTGSWFKTNVVVSTGSDSGCFPDYPTLGVDQNGIYVSSFMAGCGMSIFAFDKAPLIAGSPSLGTVTAFRGFGFEGAIQPVHTYGTPSGEYFISRNSSSSLRLRRINPPLTSPSLSDLGAVSVPSFAFPPDAPVLGSSTPLDTVGDRLMNAVYRDGFIWTAHTISVSGRAACRWYQINTSPQGLTQSGTVSDSSLYYFFPTIAVNAIGDVVMGFSGSNSSQFAACYFTGRRFSDATGAMATPILLQAGAASQNIIDGFGRNRFGDYSLTSLDPTDETAMWTVQEYAKLTNIWGTRVAKVFVEQPDCNGNGIPDACDIDCGITGGFCDVPGCGGSLDCDGNGVPDECETDHCAPTPDPMTFAVLPPTVLSDTQIQFDASVATDPSGVEYNFNKQFGPGCCGTDSGWQASTTYIATGLQANASYSYKVKARDLSINFNETALSTLFGTNSTFIETPTTITLIDAQDTQLTVSVTCDDLGDPNRCVGGSFSNLTGNPPSGLFFDMTPLEGSGSNTWVDTQQITITGLTPNTAYTFKAKARNRMAIETAFSPPVVFNTTGAAGCPTVAGDINQDTLVDGNDIPGFVRAKLGQPPVGGEDQTCADFGTGDVMLDVAAFVTALIN